MLIIGRNHFCNLFSEGQQRGVQQAHQGAQGGGHRQTGEDPGGHRAGRGENCDKHRRGL